MNELLMYHMLTGAGKTKDNPIPTITLPDGTMRVVWGPHKFGTQPIVQVDAGGWFDSPKATGTPTPATNAE